MREAINIVMRDGEGRRGKLTMETSNKGLRRVGLGRDRDVECRIVDVSFLSGDRTGLLVLNGIPFFQS